MYRVGNVVQRIVCRRCGARDNRLREGLVVGVQVNTDQSVVSTTPELHFIINIMRQDEIF